MKVLILTITILGAVSAGVPENRDKRGLINTLGYGGLDPALSLSSLSDPSLHLSANIISSPSVLSAPVISSYSSPTIIKTIQPAPTIIKTIQPAPVIKTVVAPQPQIIKVIAQPQILSYASAPSIHLAPSYSSLHLGSSLNSLSSIPSINSGGLLKSYKWGGIPVSSGISSYNAW